MPRIRLPRHKDLSTGTDCRGDHALFIGESHFMTTTTLDVNVGSEPTFFRVIRDANGEETHSHGWAQGNEVVQWG